MRYRLTAEVAGRFIFRGPLTLEADDVLVVFSTDADGKPIAVSAEVRVSSYAGLLPRMDPAGPDSWRLDIPENPHDARLIDVLQFTESIGAFALGIREVKWRSSTSSWIPDTPEEASAIRVNGYSTKTDYDHPPLEAATTFFQRVFLGRAKLQALVIPLSFLREGMRDFEELRYMAAYFNFFFCLEWLFGRGKTKTHQLEDKFLGSPVLLSAAHRILPILGDAEHGRPLEELLQRENLACSPEDLVRLLVRMRGWLHHVSSKNNARRAHPLNQHQFVSIAYLALRFCFDAIAQRIDKELPPPRR